MWTNKTKLTVAEHYCFVNAPTNLGQDKITIVDIHRQNPKSVYRLFQNVKKLEYTWE